MIRECYRWSSNRFAPNMHLTVGKKSHFPLHYIRSWIIYPYANERAARASFHRPRFHLAFGYWRSTNVAPWYACFQDAVHSTSAACSLRFWSFFRVSGGTPNNFRLGYFVGVSKRRYLLVPWISDCSTRRYSLHKWNRDSCFENKLLCQEYSHTQRYRLLGPNISASCCFHGTFSWHCVL